MVVIINYYLLEVQDGLKKTMLQTKLFERWVQMMRAVVAFKHGIVT